MRNRLALLALPVLACLLAVPSEGFAQRIGIGLGGGGGGWGGGGWGGGRGFGGPGISIGNVGIGLGSGYGYGGGYGRGGFGNPGWGYGSGYGRGGWGYDGLGYGRSGININLGSGGYGWGSRPYYGSNFYAGSGYYSSPSFYSGSGFYAPSYAQPFYSSAPSSTYVEGFAGGPVVQSGALSTQSFYPPSGEFQQPSFQQPSFQQGAAQQQDGSRAMIHVHVPSPNAQVLFDGTATSQSGMERVFSSPPLNAGQSYTYEISARWMENGQQRQMSRKVSFEAGRTVHVDFSREGQSGQPAGAIEGGVGGPQRQPLGGQPQPRDLDDRDQLSPPVQQNRDLQTPPATPNRSNPDQGQQDRQQGTPQTRPQQSQDLLPRD